MNKKNFAIDDNIFAFKMDRKSSIDIDVKEDLLIAKTFINSKITDFKKSEKCLKKTSENFRKIRTQLILKIKKTTI